MLSLLFPDENDPASAEMEAHVQRFGAVVPALFRWELRNALLVAARRKRVTYEWLFECLRRISALALEIDPLPSPSSAETELDLARRFGLGAYDAAYLEVAQRRSLPLMTRDARLGDAASKLGLLWRAQ